MLMSGEKDKDRGNSKNKGLEAGTHLECLKNSISVIARTGSGGVTGDKEVASIRS